MGASVFGPSVDEAAAVVMQSARPQYLTRNEQLSRIATIPWLCRCRILRQGGCQALLKLQVHPYTHTSKKR